MMDGVDAKRVGGLGDDQAEIPGAQAELSGKSSL
jgi:hypothetical protein